MRKRVIRISDQPPLWFHGQRRRPCLGEHDGKEQERIGTNDAKDEQDPPRESDHTFLRHSRPPVY